MAHCKPTKASSAFFITFSGDCRKALSLYQHCFGGDLHFDGFDQPLEGIIGIPVVSGSLIAEKLTIHGSDLVHPEGRRTGNFMALYVQCEDAGQRNEYLKKLGIENACVQNESDQKLIEVTDAFAVRWVFGI